MYTLAQIILMFLALASWLFPTTYLAKKNNISILSSMIISFAYVFILCGMIWLITNLFDVTSSSSIIADSVFLIFAPIFALIQAALTGIAVAQTRKDYSKNKT